MTIIRSKNVLNVRCEYCGKPMVIVYPDNWRFEDREYWTGHSCDKCVPANCGARDGMNESNCLDISHLILLRNRWITVLKKETR